MIQEEMELIMDTKFNKIEKNTIDKPFYEELIDGPMSSWKPKKSKTIIAELATIDAKQARYMLKHYNVINRKPSAVNVAKYAADMTNGKWETTGQTLSFTKEGFMIDGQHRLLAIIKSGIPQKFLISYGNEPKSFLVLDNGKTRTTADVLGMLAYKDSALLASVVRMILANERNGGFNAKNFKGVNKITRSEVIEYIESHPEISNYLSRYKKNTVVSPTDAAFAYWRFSQINQAQAEDFLDKVLGGSDLKENSIYMYLNRKLQRNRNAVKTKMTKNDIQANLTEAWNIHRGKSKKTTIQITWRPSKGLPVPK